jgi:MFS family permease
MAGGRLRLVRQPDRNRSRPLRVLSAPAGYRGRHWFEPSTAACLGVANLAGYLAGALLGRPMSARVRVVTVLRASMAPATLAFFACAFPLNFAWFFAWRFASGVAGGRAHGSAAPLCCPAAPRGEAWLAGPSSWGRRGRCRLGRARIASAATWRKRISELLPQHAEQQKAAGSFATVGYALAQVAGGPMPLVRLRTQRRRSI